LCILLNIGLVSVIIVLVFFQVVFREGD
jgi:hypothetical protein